MYELNSEFELVELEEGKCIINMEKERIILLKRIETKVFDYLLKYPIEQVKRMLSDEYEGESISSDIDDFVNELCRRNILKKRY